MPEEPSQSQPPEDERTEVFRRPSRAETSFFRRTAREEPGPTPAPGLAPGKQVGEFRLVSLLGEGGMGQVWAAEQTTLGNRRVAVKFVRPDRVSDRELSFFAREARAGGRLHHPGIVTVHASGESSGLAWIAMEQVEGAWTLRDFLDELARAHEVPPGYDREVARFVAEIAEAMQAAHESAVIHRDLKPQNVLITPDNHPKVSDFGLARITDEASISGTGQFAGTYFYMSPEQVAAKRAGIDHRTDVFSLGVVLYELLTLQRPFQGDTSHQVAAQILVKDPPDPRTIRSRAPRDLAVIAGKALEKDRDKRFQKMREFAEDLRRYLGNEPILAKPPGPLDRFAKWVKRNPTKSAAVAVATVAFVIISLLLGENVRARASLAERTKELGQSVDDLEAKTAEAEERRIEAQDQARIAQKQERIAKERADDVLRLSALQDLEDLIGEADSLWPAYPANIEKYGDWIDKAKELVAELPQHFARRDLLRENALPRSEDQRQRERESHAEFGRIAELTAEIEAKRRTLQQRCDGVATPLPDVDWSAHPSDASSLNGVAWPLIAPERTAFGQEPLGLALALRALELAGEDMGLRATIGDTVAWAYLSLGRDEETLAASRAALEAASEPEKEEYQGYLAKIESQASAAVTPEGLRAAEAELERLEGELAAVESRVDERQDWQFPEEHGEARWWNAQLTKLIEGLESLREGLRAKDAVTAEHGWSVPKRLAFAEELQAGFAPGGQYAAAWDRDLPAIRSAYPGLDLKPQMSLLPIGVDPDSGLWEFAHLMAGEPAERGADGKLLLREEMGVVLVLLPGGKFWLGAQSSDPSGQNFDPVAQGHEGPVHEVELSAFFLSKYELTQAQWKRLTGRNSSVYGPDGDWSTSWLSSRSEVSLLHPVEQVSWLDCMEWLPRAGLMLPSEAQWEYGARGGTQTPYWSGSDLASLAGVANLSDAYGKGHGNQAWSIWEADLDDGCTVHAAVGTFRANAFGLHEVHGNLWEWCQDGYDSAFYGRSPAKDPVGPWEGAANRVYRGGGFDVAASYARSALRYYRSPSFADDYLGVRPAARVITD